MHGNLLAKQVLGTLLCWGMLHHALQLLLHCLAGETACPPFEHDNRAGIDGMLHSIIAIRDRGTAHNVIGLTFRIGRHVPGKYNLLTAFVTHVN